MSFNEWMTQQTLVYPYNRILLGNNKEWTTDAQKLDESASNYAAGNSQS